MDDQLAGGEGGERRYTETELDDAERDMIALVREFNRNPDREHLTREVSAILDNCDLRAVTMVCLGAVWGMMLQLAAAAARLAEYAGDHDLAAGIEQDPAAFIENVVHSLQADYRAEDAQGDGG